MCFTEDGWTVSFVLRKRERRRGGIERVEDCQSFFCILAHDTPPAGQAGREKKACWFAGLLVACCDLYPPEIGTCFCFFCWEVSSRGEEKGGM